METDIPVTNFMWCGFNMAAFTPENIYRTTSFSRIYILEKEQAPFGTSQAINSLLHGMNGWQYFVQS